MKKSAASLTGEELNELRKFVQSTTGLFLPELVFSQNTEKITHLYTGSGQTSFSNFIFFLSQAKGKASFTTLVSHLTEEKTLFFRTSPQFEILKHNLFPELLNQAQKTQKVTIWNPGCSTGEEAYTLAFFLRELIADMKSWDVSIVATDIDRIALKKAKEGVYPKWAFRGIDKKIIEKYFERKGDEYTVRQKYRSMVFYSYHSLLSPDLPKRIEKKPGVDLIVCKNVTAAFNVRTKKKLAGTFFRTLKNNGYLLLGQREHSFDFYEKYSPRVFPKAIIYKKNLTPSRSASTKKARDPVEKEIDPIDQVIENETRTLLTVIKENDISKLKTNGRLSLHEHRKGNNKKTEETGIFDQAIQCFRKKEFDKAIDAFLKILDINSSNMRACWMLCHIYAIRGLYDEAISWGTRCIEIDPLNKSPYYTLALSYIGKGRLNEAAEKIKKAIYIDPEFTLGYFTLGNIYILLHLKSQADTFSKKQKAHSDSCRPEEISFKTKNTSVRKLLDELQLQPRSFKEEK